MITDKCINCKIDISEQILDAIEDSRKDNFDGYYDNDSNTQFVFVNCACGCLNEIKHKNGMVITIFRGNNNKQGDK